QVPDRLGLFEGTARVAAAVRPVEAARRRFGPPAPPVVQGPRAGDQVQPPVRRTAGGLVLGGAVPHLPEDLLEHVLGVLAPAQPAQERAEGAGRVAAVDLRDRGAVAGRGARQQLLVRPVPQCVHEKQRLRSRPPVFSQRPRARGATGLPSPDTLAEGPWLPPRRTFRKNRRGVESVPARRPY